MTEQKLKTLRELAEENGFPFEAETEGHQIRFIGYDNINRMVGIDTDNSIDTYPTNYSKWTLVTPKKKLVEFLYEGKLIIDSGWAQSEQKARDWCNKTDIKFIKVLREVEI